MNADILPSHKSKYEKLGKKPDTEIYKYNNQNDLQFRGIPETYKIFNNLCQSNETERKLSSNSIDSKSMRTSFTSPSSAKNIYSAAGKHQTYKLIDSKQVLKPSSQSDKKAFYLDTYAHIAAINNKRCSKRLRELAKPRKEIRNEQNEYSVDFDRGYCHTIKPYTTSTKRSLAIRKER